MKNTTQNTEQQNEQEPRDKKPNKIQKMKKVKNKKQATLKQICELMRKINESRDFEAYFKAGKPIIEIMLLKERNIKNENKKT